MSEVNIRGFVVCGITDKEKLVPLELPPKVSRKIRRLVEANMSNITCSNVEIGTHDLQESDRD